MGAVGRIFSDGDISAGDGLGTSGKLKSRAGSALKQYAAGGQLYNDFFSSNIVSTGGLQTLSMKVIPLNTFANAGDVLTQNAFGTLSVHDTGNSHVFSLTWKSTSVPEFTLATFPAVYILTSDLIYNWDLYFKFILGSSGAYFAKYNLDFALDGSFNVGYTASPADLSARTVFYSNAGGGLVLNEDVTITLKVNSQAGPFGTLAIRQWYNIFEYSPAPI